MTRHSETAVGLAYTVGAFLIWGLAPVFWKALGSVGSRELLAHRILWCGVLIVLVLTWQKRLAGIGGVLRSRRTVVTLLGTTALIGSNWFVFVWAVNSDRVLQASLGYFINPLINVLLGMVFLRERLRTWQVVSVVLATVGVLILTWNLGGLPWVSLYLAFSFGFYALLRKQVAASPEEGLGLETWLLSPFALAFLAVRETVDGGAFGHAGPGIHVLLVLTGAVTAVPLVWFTHGARRLPLTTVGLLQYMAPTMQFLLAVLVYGEPFAAPDLVAFLFIWMALALFTWDARTAWRRSRLQVEGPFP